MATAVTSADRADSPRSPGELGGSSARASIAAGVWWQLLGRGGDRLLRLITNVILARLLEPDAFGLLGMVASALAAVEAIGFIASNESIVQNNQGRDRRYLGTAFLVGALRGAVLAAALLGIAPLLARYYRQPDATVLFAAIALHPLITALVNPAVMVLVKDLRFARWNLYRFGCTAAGLAVTIVLAIALRSAWALVLGQLATAACLSLGSWLVTIRRPRLAFDAAHWRSLRAYGLRAAGTPVLLALVHQAPALLLGRWAGPAVLGSFILSQRLAELTPQLVSQVAGRVLMPVFSSLQGDREQLRLVWLATLRAVSLLCLPGAALLGWIGRDLPGLVYGSEYAGDRLTFSLLAAGGGVIALGAVCGALFWAVGLPSRDRSAQLARVACLYLAGALLALHATPAGLAAAMTAAAAVAVALSIAMARRLVDASWHAVGSAIGPGAALAACLGAGLLGADFAWSPAGWERLAGAVLAGAVCVPLLARELRGRRPLAPQAAPAGVPAT